MTERALCWLSLMALAALAVHAAWLLALPQLGSDIPLSFPALILTIIRVAGNEFTPALYIRFIMLYSSAIALAPFVLLVLIDAWTRRRTSSASVAACAQVTRMRALQTLWWERLRRSRVRCYALSG